VLLGASLVELCIWGPVLFKMALVLPFFLIMAPDKLAFLTYGIVPLILTTIIIFLSAYSLLKNPSIGSLLTIIISFIALTTITYKFLVPNMWSDIIYKVKYSKYEGVDWKSLGD
jgi:TctA family transporter